MRIFIAIDIDDSIKNRISNLIVDQARSWKGVRWVREDGIHITLKFLGEADEEKVKQVALALEKVSSLYRPMNINISSLGCFPNKQKPRVIWLGAREETGDLKRLVNDVEKKMEDLGFKKEARDFKAHVTLGRVKSHRDAGKGILFKKEHETLSFGSFHADHIVLMKSTLLPDGARYEKIGKFPLKRPPE